MKDLLSGDDSGIRNTWDEVCAQVQGEQSFYWEAYEDTIDSVILSELRKLPEVELCALWLQTDEGTDWQDKTQSQSALGVDRPPFPDEMVEGELTDTDSSPSEIPLCETDIIPTISQRVYELAEDWSNRRIRAYLREDKDY